MSIQQKTKGQWISRFAIWIFTSVITVLVLWLLGFLVEDIKTVEGPSYDAIEKQYLDQSLLERNKSLKKQISNIKREVISKEEEQRIVHESSENLQRTISQLTELQKLSVEKGIALTESQQKSLADSLDRFLNSQKKYQELNANISELYAQKRILVEDNEDIERDLEEQRKPALKRFDELSENHRLKLALYQLLILLPLLIIGAFLVIRKRSSIYFPFYIALIIATVIKVTMVMHEYFPTRYFRYIFVTVLLLVAGKFLIHFIRSIAFPKKESLLKQYKEAYERFFCPICEYPIRIGPRRFLYWTRRTIKKCFPRGIQAGDEEIYTCPFCGTSIFEECTSCKRIRHTLLAHCQHCGTKKQVD